MHTAMVMAGGFMLLGICVLSGKFAGGSRMALAKAALVFLPLWLVAAAVNTWIGVAQAGYTVSQELPIFLVIFGVSVSGRAGCSFENEATLSPREIVCQRWIE